MPKVFASSEIEEHCSFFPTPAGLKEVKSQCFVWVNEAAARLSGIAPAELQGHTVRDFWPQQAATVLARDLRCMRARQSFHELRQFTPINGDPRWINLEKRPYGHDRIFMVAEDVTVAVQLQALRLFIRTGMGPKPDLPALPDPLLRQFASLLFAQHTSRDLSIALGLTPDQVVAALFHLSR